MIQLYVCSFFFRFFSRIGYLRIYLCYIGGPLWSFILYILVCICSREGNGTPLQYSCLENPMDGGAWWAAVHGVTKSQTWLSDFTFTFMHWRSKWQATPVFLPGESQGWGSLEGCRLWGHTESDTTEATWQQQQQHTFTPSSCSPQRFPFDNPKFAFNICKSVSGL